MGEEASPPPSLDDEFDRDEQDEGDDQLLDDDVHKAQHELSALADLVAEAGAARGVTREIAFSSARRVALSHFGISTNTLAKMTTLAAVSAAISSASANRTSRAARFQCRHHASDRQQKTALHRL